MGKNIPIILALLSVWYNNFMGIRNHAVVPYNQYLSLLPAYLQQLVMESNGKMVDIDNDYVQYQTSQVIFGGAGTDVQHSFFQMIHQGTSFIPCDFIIPAISHNEIGEHHEILLANILAQGEALMRGKTTKEVVEELKKSVDLPIVYSGGITTIEDVKKLNKSGVEGIVIGSALYRDKIDLTEALKYQKR